MPPKQQPKQKEGTGTIDNRSEEEKRLDSIIEKIGYAAKAKGWHWYVQAKDKEGFRYATINVNRDDVSGTFEITKDKTVTLNGHSTSFHSYGLKDLKEAAWNEIRKLSFLQSQSKKEELAISSTFIVEKLLRNFHRMTRQLKHRYDDREPFLINDEYDIQDFLRVLLSGFFDDIRPEEYTPSYAGGSSRLDFLLKKEQIVIETKIATASLRDKKVGEQLLIDIGRYQSHPDCKKLICFVYDPQNYLKNPHGLENDLSKTYEKVVVNVIVVSP